MTIDLHKKVLLFLTAGVLLFLPGSGLAADASGASDQTALALQAGGDNPDDIRLKVGDVDVHPHLGQAFTFDDNITIARMNQQGDFYSMTSPGLALQYGRGESSISFDYQAGIQRFFRLSSMDTVDHNAMLSGEFVLHEKLRLTASQGFTRAMGGETRDQYGLPTGQIGERIPGSRTEVQNFTTLLGAEYDISQKTMVGVNLSMSFMEYVNTPGLVGSEVYDIRVPFYYHLSSKTDVFIAADAGTATVNQGADAIYEGFDIGVRTRLTGKLTGSARVGYQHREFSGSIANVDTVVALANAEWAITKRTSLTAAINRGVNPAANMANNYYEMTAADVSLHHRMWHSRITFTMGGGYERDDYGRPFAGLTGAPDRSDDYYYVRAGCDYSIKRWWSAGTGYRYRATGSSNANFEFNNNMATVYTRVSF